MKVNVIEVSATETTYITVSENTASGDETLITIKGFGHGDYRWRVETNKRHCSIEDYNPLNTFQEICGELDEEGFWDSKFFGQAAVWYTPLTFAHAVMDVLNNQ